MFFHNEKCVLNVLLKIAMQLSTLADGRNGTVSGILGLKREK